ncbi:hypothetical protein ACX1C1_09040 [Paenibacillus sp. strain BS8-2]
MKHLFKISLLLGFMAVLGACSGNSLEGNIAPTTPPSLQPSNNSNVSSSPIGSPGPTSDVSPKDSKKDKLIKDIQEFTGETTVDMNLGGENVKARWASTMYSNFGFYIPPQIKVVKTLEGGYNFQTQDDRAEIKLLGKSFATLPEDSSFIDDEFSKYAEYVVSEVSGGRQYDYFELTYKDSESYLILMYHPEVRKEVMPLYNSIFESVRYEPEKFRGEEFNSPEYDEQIEHG